MVSYIQKEILRLAFEKRFITCKEILAELWGCKGQEQGAIGKAQYNSAHASLSRCLTRLWQRGLIEYWKTLTCYRTGISLTPEGEALVITILAKAEETPADG